MSVTLYVDCRRLCQYVCHYPVSSYQIKDRERLVFAVRDIILLHEKFMQFDWLRAVVFQLNLEYLHVKLLQTFCG